VLTQRSILRLLSPFGDRVLEIILKLSSHVAQLGDRTQNYQKGTRANFTKRNLRRPIFASQAVLL